MGEMRMGFFGVVLVDGETLMASSALAVAVMASAASW